MAPDLRVGGKGMSDVARVATLTPVRRGIGSRASTPTPTPQGASDEPYQAITPSHGSRTG